MSQVFTALFQTIIGLFTLIAGITKLGTTTVSIAQDIGDIGKDTSSGYKFENQIFTQMKVNAQAAWQAELTKEDATEQSKKAAFDHYISVVNQIREAKQALAVPEETEE